jgi:hypothetical protein
MKSMVATLVAHYILILRFPKRKKHGYALHALSKLLNTTRAGPAQSRASGGMALRSNFIRMVVPFSATVCADTCAGYAISGAAEDRRIRAKAQWCAHDEGKSNV